MEKQEQTNPSSSKEEASTEEERNAINRVFFKFSTTKEQFKTYRDEGFTNAKLWSALIELSKRLKPKPSASFGEWFKTKQGQATRICSVGYTKARYEDIEKELKEAWFQSSTQTALQIFDEMDKPKYQLFDLVQYPMKEVIVIPKDDYLALKKKHLKE